MSERRTSVRVGDDIQIKTVTDGGEETFAVGASVSEGGMFVECILPYPEGTNLEVSFNLPGVGMLSVKAQVVSAERFQMSNASNRTGNGLRFDEIGDADRVRVRSFIAAQLS
ncbi:MAG: PilZ domain-containing protein [Proteobacteria bacterium]|nr:PilZ domain-containing protein [Pseudomonadota bacterium]